MQLERIGMKAISISSVGVSSRAEFPQRGEEGLQIMREPGICRIAWRFSFWSGNFLYRNAWKNPEPLQEAGSLFLDPGLKIPEEDENQSLFLHNPLSLSGGNLFLNASLKGFANRGKRTALTERIAG